MPSSKLVPPSTTISCQDFQRRLIRAHQLYVEYCVTMGVMDLRQEPIEWLDHFLDFMSADVIEKTQK